MAKHPVAGYCEVFTLARKCKCGSTWTRITDEKYPFTFPACITCDSGPDTYNICKRIDGHRVEFFFNSKGFKMRSLDEVYATSLEIEKSVDEGTFSRQNYKKKRTAALISVTIEEFITTKIFPKWHKLHMTLEDKIWIEDYLQPYLADVGVFAVSEIHLMDFIRTFRLKGEDKERAERLFNVIRKEIKL